MPTWIKYVIAAVVVLGFFALRSLGKVSSQQAHALVDGGALLLDVRTPGEFASGHIDGAVNIPVQDLANRLGEIKDKQRDIVVYCRSGGRSAQAKQVLSANGYTAVHDLGGMGRW